MLIGLVAGALYIRVVFRSTGGAADVVRSVDLTWEEARELHAQLELLLEQDPERPAEEYGARYFSDAQDYG